MIQAKMLSGLTSSFVKDTSDLAVAWCQRCKTFYGRNLRMFVKS
jgi:hypothetical protein